MSKQKNLLFVFADQWRRAAMGFAGQDPVLTPHMDAFAAQSVYCTSGISTSPLCSPARAALLTGRHPRATGVFTNCKTGLAARLQDDERCISDVLKDAGYATGYIGKWHLDEPEKNHSESPASGAKNWDAFTPPGLRRHGFDFWYSYGACDEHRTPHYWRDTPAAERVEQWSPIHETDVALDFIRGRDKQKPFCLYLSWNPPHSPYELVPQKYLSLYEGRALPLRGNVSCDNIHHHTYEPVGYTKEQLMEVTREYYAAVSGLDEQFGRLLQELKESGQWEDTIVVLTADHGDMMGSHALMAKHVWYEESIGVPLVVGGGGLAPGRCGTVIGSEDLAPTLLSLLDEPVPASMQGVNCARDIRTCTTNSEKAAYLCCCPGRDVFLAAFAAEGKNPMDYGWRGIRTTTHTYIIEAGYETKAQMRRYLHDLVADPLQLHPLTLQSAAQDPLASALEAQLVTWLRSQNDGFLQHIEQEEAAHATAAKL